MVPVIAGAWIMVVLSFISAVPAKGETPMYQFTCTFCQTKGGSTKTIAQPRLVTREGQPATFLAGGHIAVPDYPVKGQVWFHPTGTGSTMKVIGRNGQEIVLTASLCNVRAVALDGGIRTRTNSVQLEQIVKLGEEVELVLDEAKEADVTTTLKLTVTKVDDGN